MIAPKSSDVREDKRMRMMTCLEYQIPSNQKLFKNENFPPGLILIKDFFTEQQEEKILQCIKWDDSDSQQLKHRRVKHFGYEFKYGINNIDKNDPLDEKIPEICHPYLAKLIEEKYINTMPDQLTVNYYLPGQGIPVHIDTHSAFEDCIVVFNLGSQIVMEFHHPNGCHVPILLPRYSVLIMSKESRYLWSHGFIGCDFSHKLIEICRSNGLEVFVADNLKLPLRSGIADACISIAVLHHMATETRRKKAIEELVRILKVNGRALIYVWAMEQKSEKGSSNYLKASKDAKISETDRERHQIEFMGTKLPVHINKTQFLQQDIFVPWNKVDENKNSSSATVYHRYYHVFVKGELETLLLSIANVKIIESYYDQGNWCVIVEKVL
ncbi:alkylated DNA repair protein alkB homolog 8-like [Centruroides sculpturatus]|uniref:alkylated DNA repair protein alkB homolog 8-like n=1 Tax=Centruroides sculpturatus TaxID=218467 RepID=UPI000C6E3966|nr:alkylated DNA repair protein alkB homolog 8-like [Centruroides sculpturatus]